MQVRLDPALNRTNVGQNHDVCIEAILGLIGNFSGISKAFTLALEFVVDMKMDCFFLRPSIQHSG